MEQKFTVYDASAGSGKTYTIIREFLNILLGSNDIYEFKSILAITFTNKAADEMKSRLLESLLELGKDPEFSKLNHLKDDLSKGLKLDPKIIQSRSRKISQAILHDYSQLSIFTIDKFTNRIMRIFSHDLGLPVSYDVELNTSIYLEEAVDSLISKIGDDKELSKVLIDFAIRKFTDGKSWNLTGDLNKISQEIFNESSFEAIEELKKVDSSTLYSFIDKVNKLYFELRDQYREIGIRGRELLNKINLPDNSFSRSSFPNLISELENDAEFWDKPYKTLDQALVDEQFYTKSQKDKVIIETLDSYYSEIASVYLEVLKWKEQNVQQFVLLSFLRQNIESMSVLAHIENELNQLKEKNNILFNAEFNKKISEEISKEHVPYIYERIGNRYKFFFIDEFQDTSVLQWKNLIPLIENAYSQGGEIIIVGDGKQAIYRWRSGDVNQFLQLRSNQYPGLETQKPQKELDTNWRSSEQIVDFNNRFFTFVANKFSDEHLKDIYKEGSKQKWNKSFKGYVELRLNNIDQGSEVVDIDAAEYTFRTISELIEEGYSYGDICILARVNDQLSKVTNYLIEKGINVVSNESLLLKNVPEISFCINYVKSYNSKDDFLSRFKLLEYLLTNGYIKSEASNFNHYYSAISNRDKNFEEIVSELGCDLEFDMINQNSLYDSFELIIRRFGLQEKANFELQFFLDLVHEFTTTKKGDLNSFINYWNEKEKKLSLIIPEGINAVKAMSIHKSKGLEFKIVIMPYGNISFHQKTVNTWIDVESQFQDIGLKQAYVPFTKKIKYLKGGDHKKDREDQMHLLDVYNITYVAFTRAVQRLYVNLTSKKNDSDLHKILVEFLNTADGQKGQNKAGENLVFFGEKKYVDIPEKLKDLIKPIKSTESLWKDKLSISNESKGYWELGKISDREFGNLIHNVLAELEYSDQLDSLLGEFANEGLIDKQSKILVEKYLTTMMANEDLRQYFSRNFRVFNENDLIFESELLRPDRVVVNDNIATIIDYKSGLRKPEHDEQILKYKDAILSLGYQVEQCILVYLNQELNIVRV